MRKQILFPLFMAVTLGSCCHKKNVSSNQGTDVAGAVKGASTGKVSHQYKSTGCATVIIIAGDPEITLIPKDKLDKKFDMDGLEITFDYHPLKMPNPPGCNTGMPAEITNIARK